MRIEKQTLSDFNVAKNKKFLITNGLGGYASRTVNNLSSRIYSGLLIASLNPPVERRLLLSDLRERIAIKDETRQRNDNIIHLSDRNKKNFKNLYVTSSNEISMQESFEFNIYPKYSYYVNEAFIDKEIVMDYGHNTTVIKYTIQTTANDIELEIMPLINNRNHHDVTMKNDFLCIQKNNKNGVSLTFDINDIKLNLLSDKCKFFKDENWICDTPYFIEIERGNLGIDYQFTPGYFNINVQKFSRVEFSIIATTEEDVSLDGDYYINKEIERKNNLLKKIKNRDEFIDKLVLSSDNFIVSRKSTGLKTIIAGYPWFSDWGRDTMIAMIGLTLCTNRFDDAREILISFKKDIKNGLIPNMFPDSGMNPLYNTIDGTLWYFNAVYKYLEYTNDYDFIYENLIDNLNDIINNHIKGTYYSIKMDGDGLLMGGDENTQLTWMDVKVAGHAVTPRYGKAIEINALWYNAICFMIDLNKKFNIEYYAYEKIKEKIEKTFIKTFWCKETNYFYDYIYGEKKNKQIRPNGVIALSLPYSLVNKEIGKKALETVFKQLYTPYGLRSLSNLDVEFRGEYKGNLYERDMSYHQGSVWSWLIGPIITATKRYLNDTRLCEKMIEPFKNHLNDSCVLGISEIFDGKNPYNPRGAYAQAWGVGEVLRAYIEDVK